MAETTEEILRNLIAQGRITATGIRQYTLGELLLTGSAEPSGSLPTGSAEPDVSYDDLVAAELADAGIILDEELPLDTADPIAGMTAAEAAALGLSPDEFAALSNKESGTGMPGVPELDFPNVLGMAGAGASALTLAAKAALISAITTYVTNYVASQIAPIQMQVTAIGAAVPAGAGTIAGAPGKIKAIAAKVAAIVKKVLSIKKKIKSIKDAKKNIDKQIADKKQEAKNKVAEKVRQTANKALAAANKEKEKAEDRATKARKTVIIREDTSKLRPNNMGKNLSSAKVNAQAKINNPTIEQTTHTTYDPNTGEPITETFTETFGPM